ncbi:MAG: ATPase, T2SS/T4P/T4SS family [Nitriliruptoraceae bacterium]
MTTFTSPLVHIEQRVLQRAKDEALDLDGPGTSERLGELLLEEVSRWSLDFKHGLRDHDLSDPESVVERAHRNLVGYGPLEPLLADDDVWEIMINAPDQIFVKRHTGVSGYHDEAFHDDEHVTRTLTKVLDDASTSHRKLDPSEGLQDAQLDGGARVHIVHRDVGRGAHLLVNIRRFTGVAFHSLDQLVDRGMMSAQVGAFLRAASRARLSTVFAGPPGSGKTTLLSCCTAELDPSLRVVTAEEVFEVDVPLPNVASMQTRAARSDRPEIDLRRLVSGFLRMAPDVAIVGEVRDREALPLLLTLSSGVKGFTTIHAGSCRQALSRLRFICQLADTRSELPMSALNALVTEAVDIVVHSSRIDGVPRITEVVAVEDRQAGDGATAFTVTELFSRQRPDAPLTWTGNVPVRCARGLAAVGIDVHELLGVPDAADVPAVDGWQP